MEMIHASSICIICIAGLNRYKVQNIHLQESPKTPRQLQNTRSVLTAARGTKEYKVAICGNQASQKVLRRVRWRIDMDHDVKNA